MNDKRKPTVATLGAATTHLVQAMGLKDRLVAIAHEGVAPDGPLAEKPRLTTPKISTPGSRRRREFLGDAELMVRELLSTYKVDLDVLKATQPDILIAEQLCPHQAVSSEDLTQALRDVLGREITLLSFCPNSLDGIWEGSQEIGQALGLGMTAEAISQGFRARIDRVRTRVSSDVTTRPKTLVLEWDDPPTAAGLWNPELVTLAGGENLISEAGRPGVVIEDTSAIQPDKLILAICGEPLATTRETQDFQAWAKRFPNAEIFVVDGQRLFTRPGPEIITALEVLAACLHPTAFADYAELHRDAFIAI